MKKSILRLGAKVFFVVWLSASHFAVANTCQDLFQPTAIRELADLRLTIMRTDSDVLRARLEDDFEQKLAALTRQYPGRPESLRAELKMRLQGLQKDSIQKNDVTDLHRRKQEMLRVDLRGRIRLQVQTSISAMLLPNWGSGELSALPSKFGDEGTGVAWSRDERFVAIRSKSVNPNLGPTQTQIYDLQTGGEVILAERYGLLAEVGDLWANQVADQIFVKNFVTGQNFGPFKSTGVLRAVDVGSTYLIARGQKTDSFNHFTRGRIDIGHTYGICKSCGVLAFLRSGQIRILNLKTGLEIIAPPGLERNIQFASQSVHGVDDFLVFRKGGKTKILFLDDLSVHDLKLPDPPFDSVNVLKSIDRPQSHVTYVWKNSQYLVKNHDTGKELWVEEVPQLIVGGQLLCRNSDSGTWLKIDLQTMLPKKIPGEFHELIHDRFLKKAVKVPQGYQYSFYDLETGSFHEFLFSGNVDPVANSDLWIFQMTNGKQWLGISDQDYFPETEVASSAEDKSEYVGASPSGKYFVAERGGKIVILQDRHDY